MLKTTEKSDMAIMSLGYTNKKYCIKNYLNMSNENIHKKCSIVGVVCDVHRYHS